MIRACQTILTRNSSSIAPIAFGLGSRYTSSMPLEKLQGVKLPASADFHGAYAASYIVYVQNLLYGWH